MSLDSKTINNVLHVYRTVLDAASFRIVEHKGDSKKNEPSTYEVYSGKHLGVSLSNSDLTKEEAESMHGYLMDAYANIRKQAEDLARSALIDLIVE